MKTYKIEQTETAAVLWTGLAESEQAALDAMAQDAGYRDHQHVKETVGEDTGVTVREVES